MFDPQDLIGRTLGGQYRIEGLLGRGGFGAVFKARDAHLDRVVAVKVIAHTAPGLADRFRREAQVQARFRHPAIVRLLQFGEEGGLHFMVQEFVDGRTLRSVIDADGPLAPERAAAIFAELLDALDEAHAEGIVHRDIKPENIMLVQGRRGEEARLLDFGIAKIFQDSEDIQALTASGMVIGTPAWLAPEQATRQPITPAADLYSLGCVMHFSMVGQRPFQGTAVQVLLDHVQTPPPPLPAGVPEPLAGVIRLAMEKHPADRFPSAEAMRAALLGQQVIPHRAASSVVPSAVSPARAGSASGPSGSMTPVAISDIAMQPSGPSGPSRLIVAAIAALGLLVGGGVWAWLGSGEPAAPRSTVATGAESPTGAALPGAGAQPAPIGPTGAGAGRPSAADTPPMVGADEPAHDGAGEPASPDAGLPDAAPTPAPAPRPSAKLMKQIRRQFEQCDCKGAQRTIKRLDALDLDMRPTWKRYCGPADGRALSRCAQILDKRLSKAMASCPCHDARTEKLARRLESEFGVKRVTAWTNRCAVPLPGSCLAPH